MDGLRFRFRWNGKLIAFRYDIGGETVTAVTVNGKPVHAAEHANRYRHGGVRIGREAVRKFARRRHERSRHPAVIKIIRRRWGEVVPHRRIYSMKRSRQESEQ